MARAGRRRGRRGRAALTRARSSSTACQPLAELRDRGAKPACGVERDDVVELVLDEARDDQVDHRRREAARRPRAWTGGGTFAAIVGAGGGATVAGRARARRPRRRCARRCGAWRRRSAARGRRRAPAPSRAPPPRSRARPRRSRGRRTGRPARSSSSSSRHIRVVGCAPVPNAPAADSITSSGSEPSPGGSSGERTRSRPATSQARPYRAAPLARVVGHLLLVPAARARRGGRELLAGGQRGRELVEGELDPPLPQVALVHAAREQRHERVEDVLGASVGTVIAIRSTARDPSPVGRSRVTARRSEPARPAGRQRDHDGSVTAA